MPNHVKVNIEQKENIEHKGIGLAGRCLASRWYSLLFNIHLFSIFTYTWFGTKFVDVDEKAAICYLGLSQLKLNLSGFKKKDSTTWYYILTCSIHT